MFLVEGSRIHPSPQAQKALTEKHPYATLHNIFTSVNIIVMDWKKAIMYGVALYVVMFMYWSVLVGFGVGEALWGWILGYVVLAVAVGMAAKALGTTAKGEIIKYSAAWVIIMAALDALISVRFTGWGMFAMWQTYLGYAIVLLLPLSATCCKLKESDVAEAPAPPTAPEMQEEHQM